MLQRSSLSCGGDSTSFFWWTVAQQTATIHLHVDPQLPAAQGSEDQAFWFAGYTTAVGFMSERMSLPKDDDASQHLQDQKDDI